MTVARKPKLPAAAPIFDLGRVPGTPTDQRTAAGKMLARGEMPLEVRKAGRAYELVVLGTPIGQLPDKDRVCSAAFNVGRYRLLLGDFASTYIKGWCTR